MKRSKSPRFWHSDREWADYFSEVDEPECSSKQQGPVDGRGKVMGKFIIKQTYYVEAANVLEAQTKLSLDSIVDVEITRLSEGSEISNGGDSLPSLPEKESQ